MSTPKHTPGPWTVKGEDTVVGPQGNTIAECCGYSVRATDKDQIRQGGREANATFIAAAPAMYTTIQHLLEWAKGNRGAKTGNPYCIPEVRHALKTLASIQGVHDYLNADTTVEGGL